MTKRDRECPDVCPNFECQRTPETCSGECDTTPICLICKLTASCDELKKKNYVQQLAKEEMMKDSTLVIEPITIPGQTIQDILTEHRYNEMKLEELKKAYYGTPSWNFPKRVQVKGEGEAVKSNIRILRKLMKKLGIPFKVTVSLESA